MCLNQVSGSWDSDRLHVWCCKGAHGFHLRGSWNAESFFTVIDCSTLTYDGSLSFMHSLQIYGDGTASSKDCFKMFNPIDLTTFNVRHFASEKKNFSSSRKKVWSLFHNHALISGFREFSMTGLLHSLLSSRWGRSSCRKSIQNLQRPILRSGCP